MIEFAGRGILLDIEGTTSSIQFVYDVLFPYARRELRGFLSEHFHEPEVQSACAQIARDAGAPSLQSWLETDSEQPPEELIAREVLRLMDQDLKVTGLKMLQGLIWRRGYEDGTLRAHVFPDVAPAMRRWVEAGRDIRIYSSGSVPAQKLFFAHTECGDLTPLLRGYYDTQTGPKREASSYQAIARDMDLPPADILFLSDVPEELQAAGAAGFAVGLTLRPGNRDVDAGAFPALTSFEQITLK